jgi:hypothetical protein
LTDRREQTKVGRQQIAEGRKQRAERREQRFDKINVLEFLTCVLLSAFVANWNSPETEESIKD